jgi:hypothetical protein
MYRYILVHDVADSIFPVRQKNRAIMLVGYFDESGTHANSSAVFVAGYVASVEQWTTFEREWRSVWEECGIAYFHMTDWEKRSKQFTRWYNENRIELFQRPVLALRKTFGRGFSAIVNLSDYDNERFKSILPYVFCVLQCLRSVGAWANNAGLVEPLAYRLETGAGGNRAVDFNGQYILEARNTKRCFLLRFNSPSINGKV